MHSQKLKFYFLFFIFNSFIVLVSNSCNVIFAKLLGIKEPKNLPKEELKKYFEKNKYHLYGNFCYYIDSKTIDSLKNYPYKQGWEKGFRPLQFKVFDHTGNLILQYASCEGNIKKLGILNTYPPTAIKYYPYIHDSTYTLLKEFSFIKNLCNESFNLRENNYDLNVIIYWAKWMGKPSKNLVKKIIEYKRKYPNKKINIIFVNIGEISS